MYNETVMEHFTHPRNVGEVENADGVGQVGSPQCGDIMRMTIRVENGRIADVKFKTFAAARPRVQFGRHRDDYGKNHRGSPAIHQPDADRKTGRTAVSEDSLFGARRGSTQAALDDYESRKAKDESK
jgi:hypothetical protein